MSQRWCEYCGEQRAVAGDLACRDCRKAMDREEKNSDDE
jgi:tRNA(Ile2) C34 agmatinyltransferase TiaS